MKRIYWLLCLIWISSLLNGQTIIRGKVVDQESSEALPFAQVLYDTTQLIGVTANIHGEFSIRSLREIEYLRVSYIGYQPQIIALSQFSDEVVLISLRPRTIQTEEVWIIAEKNPAEGIIRKVIAHKKQNNPERIESYSCDIYNKTVYDFLISGRPPHLDSLRTRRDSGLYNLHQFARQSAIFIMESSSSRIFRAPDQVEETVTATRVSGFKHPTFASLATDFQPFSFYQEIIPLFDKLYINPISYGSLSKYDFRLRDTLYQETDTVYVIEYKPKKGKNFDGLEGLLYINTHLYGIQNVIATPHDKGPIEIRIEQLYSCVNREQWFPGQLNFEVTAPHYPSPSAGMRISGKSYVSRINLSPRLSSKDFTFKEVLMAPGASQLAEQYWDSVRTYPLTAKEQRTYVIMDSIGADKNFDGLMRQAEKIANNRLALHFLDIDIEKLFLFNEYEGNRLGMGLHTNERISSKWEFGGYFGYGFRDKRLKYGGDLKVFLDKSREAALGFSYIHDVVMPGLSSLEPQSGLTNLKSYITSRMDLVKQMKIFGESRLSNYASLGLEFNKTQRKTGYNYEFEPLNLSAGNPGYNLTELHIRLKYAYKEKIVESFGQNMSLGSKYPILTLAYTQGIPGWFQSNLAYHKFEFQLEQDFQTKLLGTSSLFLRGGYIDRSLPVGLLFHGEGTHVGDIWALIPHSFQTMRPFEFLSDQYVEAFWRQDFGSLLFKTQWFKPRIELWQGAVVGKLRHADDHKGIIFQSLEKGYFETGLVLQQLISNKIANLAYLGLGGGVFYRYGAYHLINLKENFAFKVAVNLATN